MTEKEIFGILSVIPGIIGFGNYIWTIFRKRTKPHMLTWIVWVIITGVVFAAQCSQNAGAGSWALGLGFAGCSLIAVISLFHGEKRITWGDKIAFAGGLATIPLWYFTKNPLWSVILATAIDGFAFYPTFRKSWLKPYEESTPLYTLDAARLLISLFAIENLTLTSILYPLFVMLMNTSFVVMLCCRRAVLKKP